MLKPYYIYRTSNGWLVSRIHLSGLFAKTGPDYEHCGALASFNSSEELLAWLIRELQAACV